MAAKLALIGSTLLLVHGKHALGWVPEDIFGEDAAKVQTFHDLEALRERICQVAQPGDHVLIMSNGSFGGLHGKLLDSSKQSS